MWRQKELRIRGGGVHGGEVCVRYEYNLTLSFESTMDSDVGQMGS